MIKFESGRSMIEMLGVLVIVGVLSIGAFAGYTYAMNKTRANQTVNDIILRDHVLKTQYISNLPLNLGEFPTHGQVGYLFTVPQKTGGGYTLGVTGVPQSVCQMVYDMMKEKVYQININDKANAACRETDNKMDFYFTQGCPDGFVGTNCDECGGYKSADGICCANGLEPCYGQCCGAGYKCNDITESCIEGDDFCFNNEDCPDHQGCFKHACIDMGECKTDADCPAEKPKCVINGRIWESTCMEDNECNSNADCTEGNKRFCHFSYHQCVECLSDDDCDSHRCDVTSTKSQCAPVDCTDLTSAGYINEHTCRSCAGYTWNSISLACCPMDTRGAAFQNLTGEYCNACQGVVLEGKCTFIDCSVGLKAQPDKISCSWCGGLWRSDKCQAVECKTNEECPDGKYCGSTDIVSHFYPSYNICVRATYEKGRFLYNGQEEVWYRSASNMSWWDAIHFCEALGLSLQPRSIVYPRWRELASVGWGEVEATARVWLADSTAANMAGFVNLWLGSNSVMDKDGWSRYNTRALCR